MNEPISIVWMCICALSVAAAITVFVFICPLELSQSQASPDTHCHLNHIFFSTWMEITVSNGAGGPEQLEITAGM